ncbi:serine/threonine-protein kinase [Streptomyces koyangensis]|uniref:serine/threonine-protein kinase n=1 Tax=Streptomyces TaxID=1883 RepID=UPI001CB920B4|nr:serine/threonine-protein kinase [Streptomyces sp. EAG2]
MSAPGDMIGGRFTLLGPLGSGGMGTVWRARDEVLHREVALKEVRPPDPALTGPEAAATLRERVLREARALARLSHPHVVTIHQIVDAGPDTHPWIVMELVPGESLADRLQRGPLLPQEAAALGRQILAALRSAHAAGIHHRDVKPANILLRTDPGVPGPPSAVLTDFGIAALQGSTALTATGDLIGSPEYIAPERVRGRDDHPASDLWSLGLVLYVAVEGHSPLRRATMLATLAAVLDEPVPPPVRSGPLAAVLGALLVRDPEARPDAATLDRLLTEAASGSAPSWAEPTVSGPRPVPATPVAPPPPAPPTPPPGAPAPGTQAPAPYRPPLPTPTTAVTRPRRRTGALVAGAAALVAVAVTATVLVLNPWKSDDQAAPSPSPSPTAPQAPDGEKDPKPSPDAGRSTGTDPVDDDKDDKNGNGEEDQEDQDKEDDRSGQDDPPAPSATPQPPSGGSWIAQLFSEPVSTGTATRDRRLAAVRAEVPEARYLRSDDYASLRPGYWVFYAPGPFDDGRAALRFCAEKGRTSGNECVGRYLSDDGADADAICHPPAASPKGRCSRS